MALQQVEWTSCIKLGCLNCLPADVILCITPGLVRAHDCETEGQVTTFPWSTILAQVVNYTKSGCRYRYGISYDDSQLIDGALLAYVDILGVICEGCLTSWVREQVGDEIKLELVPATEALPAYIQLTTQHGCIYQISTLDLWGGPT
jgi:hypothetical protein